VQTGLSFAALQSPRGWYLLEDFTLHYAPAGAMFQFTSALRRPDARKGHVLLVSDPALPPTRAMDADLPRLPGARAEAGAIAGLLPRARVTALQDGAASEGGIRKTIGDFPVLHSATHAVVRDDEPFGSYLALARSGHGNDVDGRLTAEDVYRLRLHADLVVLSACRAEPYRGTASRRLPGLSSTPVRAVRRTAVSGGRRGQPSA
jgi:CHAT domain-containing protein